MRSYASRMFIILGATGHIGSALCEILAERSVPYTAVTRKPEARARLEQRGARVAVCDVHDVRALRAVFSGARRAYLLNPPADPASDTVAEERATVRAILQALEGSGLEQVVAQSTYGAQPADAIGDLGVLHEFELGLRAQAIPAAIVRGAYYMVNWDYNLEAARSEGVVHSFFPADFELPMIAPRDLAQVAAELLLHPTIDNGLYYAEGPERYTPADVASAFSRALERPVRVEPIPEDSWLEALRQSGFSERAAQSMAAMTRVTLERCERPDAPLRGRTTLEHYIRNVVAPQARG